MRIGLVTTSYPRHPGDPAGSFVAGHAAYLASRGFEVEVVAAGAPEPGASGRRAVREERRAHPGRAPATARSPIEVVRVPAPAGLFDRGGAPESLERSAAAWAAAARFSVRLAAEVRRRARRWDAAVAHWLAPSAIAAQLARVPLLAIAHGGDVHLLARTGAALPVAALLCAADARVVFVSRALRDRFLGALPSALARRLEPRARVSRIGIDVAGFRSGARREPPADPHRVLFLGRLVPIKGARVAVEASRRWRAPARLQIAGAGPDAAALARLARERGAPVDLLGAVGPEARRELLASAGVMLVPSLEVAGRTEGMPVAALEGIAAGVPVIASRSGGLAELPLCHTRPGDAAAVAAAVDRLLGDPAARAAQLARQERLVDSLDWSAVGPQLTPRPARRR